MYLHKININVHTFNYLCCCENKKIRLIAHNNGNDAHNIVLVYCNLLYYYRFDKMIKMMKTKPSLT